MMMMTLMKMRTRAASLKFIRPNFSSSRSTCRLTHTTLPPKPTPKPHYLSNLPVQHSQSHCTARFLHSQTDDPSPSGPLWYAAVYEAGKLLLSLYTDGTYKKVESVKIDSDLCVGKIMYAEDNLSRKTKVQFLADIQVYLGGYIAERMKFGADLISSGASLDLASANECAWRMVTAFGMGPNTGPISYSYRLLDFKNLESFRVALLSPSLRQSLEAEARAFVVQAHQLAEHTLKVHKRKLDALAADLYKHKTLSRERIEKIISEVA